MDLNVEDEATATIGELWPMAVGVAHAFFCLDPGIYLQISAVTSPCFDG